MKKKILFIHQQLCVGGVERVLLTTLQSLDPNKYDISLLLLYPGTWDGEVPSHVRLQYAYKKRPLGRFYKYSRIFFPVVLRRTPLVREKFNLVISSHTPTLWYLRLSSCRKVQWIHTDMAVEDFPDVKTLRNRKFLYRLVSKCVVRAFDRCDKIVCVAQSAVKSFLDKTGISADKVMCLYNLSNEELVCSKSQEPCELDAVPDQTNLLVVVARIAYQKALHRLIPLAGSLRNDGFDFKIVIVGDGPLRNNLEAGIRDAGLSNYFLFVGYQVNPYKYMSRAKLIVNPALWEAYCTVTKEAILLHKPFVTTECSGMREQIAGSQAGLIVANADDSLYPSVRDVLRDEDLYRKMCLDSAKRAEELSDKESMRQLELFLDSQMME